MKPFDNLYNLIALLKWAYFPASEAERSSVASGFKQKYNVPDVLGFIDCTHVKIFPLLGPQGIQFKNRRKDAHTINVQLV